MDKIKLLVVDDSILFREVLARYIRLDEQIDVVGTAGDAYSARDMILKFEPDVMTLDLEMPRMDGIAFLRKLLPQYYIPTIVVSSSEQKDAAKEAGAVEFLTKPSARTTSDMERFAAELCAAIKRAAKTRSGFTGEPAHQHPHTAVQSTFSHSADHSSAMHPSESGGMHSAGLYSAAHSGIQHSAEYSAISQAAVSEHTHQMNSTRMLRKSDTIIALGASTGGTEALETVLRDFPADVPPVLVVQHMPAGFTKMYAERLNRSCQPEVKEAADGDRLRRGLVIIGAGDNHLRLCRDTKGYYVSSRPGEKITGHCPSVNVLFESVAQAAGANAIGVILTGMGKDGADGLLKMHRAGAFTIGQDKSTCVVYGMPMEAYNIGAVQLQAPLYDIARIIFEHLY